MSYPNLRFWLFSLFLNLCAIHFRTPGVGHDFISSPLLKHFYVTQGAILLKGGTFKLQIE